MVANLVSPAVVADSRPVWGPKYESSWSLASATVGSKPLLVINVLQICAKLDVRVRNKSDSYLMVYQCHALVCTNQVPACSTKTTWIAAT